MEEIKTATTEEVEDAVTPEERAAKYDLNPAELELAAVQKKKKGYVKKGPVDYVFAVSRVAVLIMFFLLFIPSANTVSVTALVDKNTSLFTSGISYSTLIANVGRGFRQGWVEEGWFMLLYVAALLTLIGIVTISASACTSLGNIKFRHLSFLLSFAGSVLAIVGYVLTFVSYTNFASSDKQTKVEAAIPSGIWIYIVLTAIVIVCTVIELIMTPKYEKGMKFEMESQFKLFLMFLPFALLAFVFCYLPLWGWRYAFFDYKAGDTLSMDKWVGLKWFKYLFQNDATKRDIIRVLKNTLAMSGLGIITSWIPLAFAVFLSEIKNKTYKRFVQTFTTIPNFISWILVYTVALSIFSTDGFINTFLTSLGQTANTNYLMDDSHIWLKMLAWGVWKSVGWSAIIYIAGISGIDKQLYEAATVDGAGRFQRIWNVTIPGLMPTYMVMLLMSVAGMLSNGLDQYLVFSNAKNINTIEVLDLYVYNLGFSGGSIPLSTVVGMTKSIVSVALLFMANSVSKLVRHESIV